MSFVREFATPRPCWCSHHPNGMLTTPGRTTVGHAGRQVQLAALVPHPHGVTVGDPAGASVGGGDLEPRRALGRAVLGQVRVRGVEEARVRLRRQQGEGEPPVGRSRARLHGQGVEATGGELGRRQAGLAVGGGEAAGGVGAEVIRQRQPDEAVGAECSTVGLLERRQRDVEQLVVGGEQRGIGEPERARQPSEQLGVRNRLAERRDRRARSSRGRGGPTT